MKMRWRIKWRDLNPAMSFQKHNGGFQKTSSHDDCEKTAEAL